MPNSDSKDKVRQGFTFFRSFRDAVAMTDPDEQLVLYKAIADYALDQTEPDISTLGSLGKLCWTAIRPNIESGLIRFYCCPVNYMGVCMNFYFLGQPPCRMN